MSDPNRTSVKVRIAGEEHVIRTNADPEYTRRCAALVDERIAEIRERAGLVETHRVAILAALSLADETFRSREDLERLRAEVEAKVSDLSERISGAGG